MSALEQVHGSSSSSEDKTAWVQLPGGAFWIRGSSSAVEHRPVRPVGCRMVRALPAPTAILSMAENPA